MSQTRNDDRAKGTAPWETPALRKISLTEKEIEALRASDDPMALLLAMKPELGRKGEAG